MDVLSLSSNKCQISSPISVTGVFPDQSAACSRHSIKGSMEVAFRSQRGTAGEDLVVPIKGPRTLAPVESLQKQGSLAK